MPFGISFKIKIINKGSIYGYGGSAGNGASGQTGDPCTLIATGGNPGGPAITTSAGVSLSVDNNGLIAGGGCGRYALGYLGVGGAAGKAISGGSGNIIININGGQGFGVID